MNKLTTLTAGAALMGTTALAQTGYPPAIQGQIDRLVAGGYTITEIYRDGRSAEIDARGPDGRLYELELDGNVWEMSLAGSDDEDEDEGEDEGGFGDEDEDEDEDERFDDEDEDEDEDESEGGFDDEDEDEGSDRSDENDSDEDESGSNDNDSDEDEGDDE